MTTGTRGFGRSEDAERRAAGGGAPPSIMGNGQPKGFSQPKAPPKEGPQWAERKAPELFSFKGEGDVLEGVLVQAGLVEINDKESGRLKKVMQYVIEGKDENGAAITWKIIGSWDINQKLSPRDHNSLVRITYIGENKDVKKGDNYMKMFEVLVAPPPRASRFSDGHEITDADISF